MDRQKLPFWVLLVLLVLLPLAFGQLFATAMYKLHLTPGFALLAMAAILFGSAVNIPVKRILRTEEVAFRPWTVFDALGWWRRPTHVQKETIIAVNVGGCLAPLTIALYETLHILISGWSTLFAALLACAINIGVCHTIAKPVRGVGIAMPALIPPLVAVTSALILAPEQAVPVAFVAGVMGPLVGADLMNLKQIPDIATGMASIGGAGTFDGIVLSGILAAYLA